MPGSVDVTLSRPARRSKLRRILFVKCCRTPVSLMFTAWGIFGMLFVLGPVAPVERVRWSTWGLIGLCIGVFSLGCVSARGGSRVKAVGDTEMSLPRLQRLVRVFAILGLVGGAFIVIDKVWLSGLDTSAGFTSIRFQSAELGAAFSNSYARSPLLYIGLITYSFSLIGFVTYILRAEQLPLRLLYLTTLSLASPFAVATVYGGRSMLFVALILPLGALLIRRLRGKQSALKRLKPLLVMFLFIGLLAGAYDNSVQNQRREIFGFEDYKSELQFTETARNFRVKPWVEGLINAGVPAEVVLQSVSLGTYVAQGAPNFDLILHHDGPVGPFYGQYEIASLGSWLGRIIPELSVVDRMYTELDDADVLGVFVSTWGALYVDFGLIGMLLIAFLWGWVSSRIWTRATRSDHLGAQVLAALLFLTIVSCPIHSAIGAGTGTFLALDAAIAYRLLSPKRKHAKRGPDAPRIPAARSQVGASVAGA